MKKKIVNVVLVLCLMFSIFVIYMQVDSLKKFQLEEKIVWFTTDVIRQHGEGSFTYFIRYDDYNGEKGIIRLTSSQQSDLKKGDSSTVYRNVNGGEKSDSTHGWHLNAEVVKRSEVVKLVLWIIISIIFSIVLIKRLKNKDKEK